MCVCVALLHNASKYIQEHVTFVFEFVQVELSSEIF